MPWYAHDFRHLSGRRQGNRLRAIDIDISSRKDILAARALIASGISGHGRSLRLLGPKRSSTITIPARTQTTRAISWPLTSSGAATPLVSARDGRNPVDT